MNTGVLTIIPCQVMLKSKKLKDKYGYENFTKKKKQITHRLRMSIKILKKKLAKVKKIGEGGDLQSGR